MPKPRVFISSVINNFEIFREAARAGITKADGSPVLINEDYPSANKSSRNACLDGVESCDILVLIIGARGGWTAPSGKLVVEEEFEHARLCNLPCIAFIQKDVVHDNDAAKMIRSVGDYIDGRFVKYFSDPEELKIAVETSLSQPISMARVPLINLNSLNTLLTTARPVTANQASIRFLIIPERDEEVISPMKLASGEFADRIFEIAHSSQVKLLSYKFAKDEPAIDEKGHLILFQSGGTNYRQGQRAVRIEVSESGLFLLDLNVTGLEQHGNLLIASTFGILENDLKEALNACFSFMAVIYEHLDAFKRHAVFAWNVALVGADHRRILKGPNDPAANYPNVYNSSTVLGFVEPRTISRITLNKPSDEIERAILRWSQKLAVKH